MSPLLSIVVPTKNRYTYLYHLIELIKSFESNEIELVIQDNSDDNSEFCKFVSRSGLDWLKYFYCPEKLTSIENFDRGILNCTGEFICFIGDDDGVTRYIIDCARWMKNNNIEAVRGAKTYYYWPEVIHKGLITCETSNKVIEFLNPIEELKHILKEGCQFLENIPVTYAGMVKREVLDKIFSNYGTYFPGGASADIANGVALCFYVKRYAKIHIPIIITGTSKQTGGSINRSKPLSFSEVPFISPFVAMNWEGNLPQYWLGPLVWPESAVKSLRALGKESFILELDYNKVMARTIIRSKFKKGELMPYIKSKAKVRFYIISYWINYILKGVLGSIIRFLSKGAKGWHQCRLSGVQTIIEAEEALQRVNSSFPSGGAF